MKEEDNQMQVKNRPHKYSDSFGNGVCERDECGREANDPVHVITEQGPWREDYWTARNDSRVNYEDPRTEAVARRLHGNKSMHLHQVPHLEGPCSYCWLDAQVAIDALDAMP